MIATVFRFIALILLTFNLSALAQQTDNRCLNDLIAFDQYIRKLPSFKQQIVGDKKTEYLNLLEVLKQNTAKPLSDFDCFCQITQLLNPIKDNHLAIYQTNSPIDYRKLADSTCLEEIKTSAFFKAHPRTNLDLKELEEKLSKKALDDVEGIYSQWGIIKLGVFRASKPDSLVGVVLKSLMGQWEKDDIWMILHEKAPNKFRSVVAFPNTKDYLLQMNDKFVNGMLTESGFSKMNKPKSFEFLNAKTPVYDFKTLSKDTQYLRLGSFNAMNEFLPVAQKFYDSIKDSLTAPNLIVDLRNNGGGAFKNSGKFLKLIEKYSKKGKVYTIVNGRTVSNAEQFTLKLKKLKKHTLLGARTCGTLTYGSNYGTRYDLPSKRYEFAVTDMKGRLEELKFEEIGIEPDVYLKTDTDFVEQVLDLINKK